MYRASGRVRAATLQKYSATIQTALAKRLGSPPHCQARQVPQMIAATYRNCNKAKGEAGAADRTSAVVGAAASGCSSAVLTPGTTATKSAKAKAPDPTQDRAAIHLRLALRSHAQSHAASINLLFTVPYDLFATCQGRWKT